MSPALLASIKRAMLAGLTNARMMYAIEPARAGWRFYVSARLKEQLGEELYGVPVEHCSENDIQGRWTLERRKEIA
jgi:hypothetical protein